MVYLKKTVRFIFNGNVGNRLNLVFGYWDTAANVWVNNDNTKLGWFEFDKNGEAIVEIQVPENAKNVHMITYNYTTIEDGKNVQLDKDLLELKGVIEL